MLRICVEWIPKMLKVNYYFSQNFIMNHNSHRRLHSDSAAPHLQGIYPNKQPACLLSLLISSKLTYCIGVFVAYDILRELHFVPLLCLLKLM